MLHVSVSFVLSMRRTHDAGPCFVACQRFAQCIYTSGCMEVTSPMGLCCLPPQAEDIYISPDVPLIYVSCISTVTLLYFILFVDCKALVSLP